MATVETMQSDALWFRFIPHFLTRIRITAYCLVVAWLPYQAIANGWEHTAIPVELLIEALGHDDAQIRQQAAHSLGHHHTDNVTRALLTSLQQGEMSDSVRQAIFASLGKIGSPLALKAVDQCLRHDPLVATRTLCAAAVGNIFDSRSLSLAQFALNAPEKPVKRAAITSLGYLGGALAVESLTPFVGESSPFRLTAIRALGYSAHPSAIPAIAKFIHPTSEPALLVEALKAVTRLGSKEILQPIQAVFNESSDQRVRRFALIALHSDTQQGQSQGLVESLHDPDPLMKIQALELIRELGDQQLLDATISIGSDFAVNFYKQTPDTIRNNPKQALVNLSVINEFLRTVIAIDPHHGDPLFAITGQWIDFAPRSPIELSIAQGLYKARWQSIYGAGYTHPGAMDDLILAGFSDSDARLRAVAVRSMGVNNPERFLEQTLISMNDKVADVRRQGAIVLGRARGLANDESKQINALLQATFDDHFLVRIEAISSLGYLGNPTARQRLTTLKNNDADARIRASASHSLALLKKEH